MITVALARQHCRVDTNDDDDLIEQYSNAAQAWVENYTGLALSVRTFTQVFDCFPARFQLSRGPVTALTSISTSAGPLTGARLLNGRVYPADGEYWPALTAPDEITVVYEAGLVEVPADLVSAQLLLIADWYNNREASSERPTSANAFAVEALCRPYRRLLV